MIHNLTHVVNFGFTNLLPVYRLRITFSLLRGLTSTNYDNSTKIVYILTYLQKLFWHHFFTGQLLNFLVLIL